MSWVEDSKEQPFPTEKPKDENDNAVIFVHGWSMDYPNYISFSETMFKRLWQMGFKGRFCTLRWDPLMVAQLGVIKVSNGEYNRSEHRAWLYGESLKEFVEAIKSKGFKVSIIGHSMGNVVCGSALQKGLSVENYLLMEAAIPAGCFDASGGINSYGRFITAEASEPTPDYHYAPNGEETKGYRGFLSSIYSNVVARVVNYHNSDDYALATGHYVGFEANWERNEIDCKPDGNLLTDWHYCYNPRHADVNKRATQEFTLFAGRFVTDSFEMKSFVARPHSKAAGAVDGVGSNPNPSGMEGVNLRTAYHFDTRGTIVASSTAESRRWMTSIWTS
jgi:pimeloyl-ACP methyl ester carboxylesterase